METAENLLGRPFALTGTIVPGDHRGRTIGFATANMLIPINMAIPPDGVYVTELWWDGEGHPAMTNIGDNPTSRTSTAASRPTSSTGIRIFTARTSACVFESVFAVKKSLPRQTTSSPR